MSDQSQGPGWWLASDGRWYPPDQAPAVPPSETWATPPPAVPPSGGMSSGAKVGLIVGVSTVLLLVLVALVAILVGSDDETSSSGPAAEVGSVDVPDGYALVEGDGVSIAVPEDWREIAPGDFAMSAEEFEAAFPDAPDAMFEQGSTMFEQGAVLVAFDLSSGFASNVNIIDAPGEAPLGMVESQAGAQLETLGATVVSTGRVDLPVGEALRVEYTLDVALPDGSSAPASGTQYYVPLDGRTYIITVSTSDDTDEIADVMADTFRVT